MPGNEVATYLASKDVSTKSTQHTTKNAAKETAEVTLHSPGEASEPRTPTWRLPKPCSGGKITRKRKNPTTLKRRKDRARATRLDNQRPKLRTRPKLL